MGLIGNMSFNNLIKINKFGSIVLIILIFIRGKLYNNIP
jgi:hypothetical protein